MLARRPSKVVAVAQAARTARILWAMLTPQPTLSRASHRLTAQPLRKEHSSN